MVKFLCLLVCFLAGNFALETSSEPVELFVSPRRRYSPQTSRRDRVSRTRITDKPGAGDGVKNAFLEFCIGFVLVILAFPCLYYNEKRQVHMEKIFAWAEPRIKDVSAKSVDEDNEATVVCVQGESSTDEKLRDSDLGVEVKNCSKLSRAVEMFQWIEDKREETRDVGDGKQETKTTYSYRTDWASHPIDSKEFEEQNGHENPPFPLRDQTWTAKDVKLGAFNLDSNLIGQMSNWSSAEIEPQDVGGKRLEAQAAGTIQSGGGSAEVGDLRITMKKVQCGTCTVASLQSGASFQPLTYALVPSGCCKLPDKVDFSTAQLNPDGGDVEVQGACTCIGALIQSGECIHNLYESEKTGKQIIDIMKQNQKFTHIALQFCGFIMFLVGNYYIFKLGGSVFEFIPLIGSWIDSVWKALAFLAAIMCACQCWLVTVAVSWLALRPLKGILMLAAAAALFVAINVLTEMDGAPSQNATLI